MSRSVGPGKRRGEVVVIESEVGGVYARVRGNKIRLLTGPVRLLDDHPASE